jgi:hypothetical protein
VPLYEIDGKSLRRHDSARFAALGIYERKDLQRLLRDDIGGLSPDLLVIAEEFGNWEDSRRREFPPESLGTRPAHFVIGCPSPAAAQRWFARSLSGATRCRAGRWRQRPTDTFVRPAVTRSVGPDGPHSPLAAHPAVPRVVFGSLQ